MGKAGSAVRRRVRAGGVAALRGLLLTSASLGASPALFVVTAVSLALIPLGVGLLTTPLLLRTVRRHANVRRLFAAGWCGVRIPSPYAPLPDRLPGTGAWVREGLRMLREPATWRDLAWLPVDMTAGAVLALPAPGLVAEGVFGVLTALGLWKPLTGGGDGTFWFEFVPVSSWPTALLAGLAGCVWLVTSAFAGPLLVHAHFRCAAALLDRTRAPD